jgi:hypothetical protein
MLGNWALCEWWSCCGWCWCDWWCCCEAGWPNWKAGRAPEASTTDDETGDMYSYESDPGDDGDDDAALVQSSAEEFE